MNAILSRDVKGRGFRARQGTACELLHETQPGMWMVLLQCMLGHDRVAYIKADVMIFDPTDAEVT